jgi:hypothetical protein
LERGDVNQSITEHGADSKKSPDRADEAAGMETRWRASTRFADS